MKSPYKIYSCGDSALTVSLGDEMDTKINDHVLQLFTFLKQTRNYWLDVIPAYTSVTVIYDSVALQQQGIFAPHHWVKEILEKSLNEYFTSPLKSNRTLHIPVWYDLSVGPDSKRVCEQHKISLEELIHLHTSKMYRVYMIGFLPGFAYMGNVDPKIATPRLVKPHAQVAAGSIGIAGNQTGIYPVVSPGGWNIIGKTPVKLFDTKQEQNDNAPVILFQPGDEVMFKSITKSEFDAFDSTVFNPLQS